jgi:hypothetical protein
MAVRQRTWRRGLTLGWEFSPLIYSSRPWKGFTSRYGRVTGRVPHYVGDPMRFKPPWKIQGRIIKRACPSQPPRKAGNGKKVRQAAEGPISAGRRLGGARKGSLPKTSREEAPEEMIFCLRDAAPSPSGCGAKRDARSEHPKKGRGTSDGLAPGPARPLNERRTLG